MKFHSTLHIIYIGILMVIVAAAAMPVAAQNHDTQPKWEQTDNIPGQGRVENRPGADTPSDNVTVRDMYIYVELEQPAAVKLFTILGQPVSQMQLPAGTSRFRVSARGIYILKIGSATRRITI